MITIVESPDGTRTINIDRSSVRIPVAIRSVDPVVAAMQSTAAEEVIISKVKQPPARFVKLDAAGKPLPADSATFAAVQDNQTGLQWSATLTEGLVDHASAEKACQALDLAGHGDWRLPTRVELESILDLSRHKPAADPVFFGDTRTDDWYWTSSPCAWRSGASWCVVFDYGLVNYDVRHYRCFVRAVRSVAPAPGQ